MLVTPLIALFSHRPLALLLSRTGIATTLTFGIRLCHGFLLCAYLEFMHGGSNTRSWNFGLNKKGSKVET
jgi:hypothetical protein